MASQGTHGKSYDHISVTGGTAHFGDQYVSIVHDEQSEQRAKWLQFLASLRFKEMNARFNEIKDAGKRTFQWVFDDDPDQHPTRATGLATWLADSGNIFLVQGKAGSGKSTFMKFIFEHDSTKARLQQWAGPKPLVLLFHSFWLVGTKIQHSFKGFLASLIHQVVSDDHSLLSICQSVYRQDFKHSLDDWNEKELKRLLLNLCQHAPFAFCFFVDGLDEFDRDDDFENLHDFILEILSSNKNCKFCLSTRPLTYILHYFTEAPGLRLQDLTEGDIISYVHDNLLKKAIYGLDFPEKAEQLKSIEDAICRKAEGVFLWVHYVLKNVCSGLRIGDDLRALEQRIAHLPSAIEELYRHMWRLQNVDNAIHSKEAAMIFSFGRHFPMSLFQLGVVLRPELLEHYMSTMEVVDEAYLRKVCETTTWVLHNRSAGLIECVEDVKKDYIPDATESLWGLKGNLARTRETWRRTNIQYIHRTVHDFLTGSEEGHLIINSDSALSAAEVDHLWLQSSLACYIEDVRGFSLSSLARILRRVARRDQWLPMQADMIDAFGKHLVTQRIDPEYASNHNWVWKLRCFTGADSFYSDFPGFFTQQSPMCLRFLLNTRGRNWSSYYKGYLAFCTVIRFLWADSMVATQSLNNDIVEVLSDLLHAGADLISPHAYGSSMTNALAIRSPAARLVQEFSKIVLAIDHIVNFDMLESLTRFLSDLDLGTQHFTLYWGRSHDDTPGSFDSCPDRLFNWMFTFRAADVLKALCQSIETIRAKCSHHPSRSTSGDLSIMLRGHFRRMLPDLVLSVRLIWNGAGTQHSSQVRNCTTEQVQRLCSMIFGNSKGRTALLKEVRRFNPMGEVPTWPESDLSFKDEEDEFAPYLEPLDPFVDIGPHNWMEEGSLKRYFAQKKALQKGADQIEESMDRLELQNDVIRGDDPEPHS